MNRHNFLLQSPILSQMLPCVLTLFRQYYYDLTLVIFNSKHNKTLLREDQILSDSYADAPAVECKKTKKLSHSFSEHKKLKLQHLYFGKYLDRTISDHLWELCNPSAIRTFNQTL